MPEALPPREGSLRAGLLRRLAVLLALLLVFSGWSAYWNGRAAADTAYDRTLLASARAIAEGLVANDGKLRANVPYVALDTFAYDSAGRIYYQVLDTGGRLVSGYEDLPAPIIRRWRVSTMANFAARAYAWSVCCSRSASLSSTASPRSASPRHSVPGSAWPAAC
jgi:hypothetical protein